MRKITLLAFICVFSISAGSAQKAGSLLGKPTQKGNQFLFTSGESRMYIDLCTESMFRVRMSWSDTMAANEPWMVSKYDWPEVSATLSSEPEAYRIRTADLSISINKGNSLISVYDQDGKLLSQDAAPGEMNGSKVTITKKLSPQDHFFGFGERMDFIDQRNKKLELNVGRGKGRPHIIGAYDPLQANYSPVPFFMSTLGYGIFFHNAYPTTWDMGSTNDDRYSFSATGGALDYYFIKGPSLKKVLGQYTSLTGRSPLLPRFALGLHVGTYSGGTWGYEELTSDSYVVALARRLRELGIPADLIWLDSTWRIFGENGGKGATSFEWRETFKDPKGMFDSLYAMNYSMGGVHLRPRFDNGNKIKLLDTARKLGFTYPEQNNPGEFVNYFDSNAVNFWWEHGVKRLADIGVKFLKTDEGSAFGALANESDKVGPTGKDIPRLHNLFPIAYAAAPYEKFQRYNHERGLNQTREGYAGIQRYPFIFAGDWPSEWQYFEPVIKAGLNIGLSGVGFWTHCMGGFEHDADPELYMRWVQFGMFSPIAMVFGMDHPGYKEPWNYGDSALANFRKYDSLRYTLLPYLYSSSWEQYQTGVPMMRAMVLEFPKDENVYSISDQYMLGDALMVCPVTGKGAQTRVVYFPEGEWYDFWTGEKISGKQYRNIVAPTDFLPLYVKAGGILTQQKEVQSLGNDHQQKLIITLYPGNASMMYYEDDGKTLDYQDGRYNSYQLSQSESSGKRNVLVEKIHSGFQGTTVDQMQFRLMEAAETSRVLINGTPVQPSQVTYDKDEKILKFTLPVSSKRMKVEIN